MRKILLSLTLLLALISAPAYSVTIMKNVGHGDSYVVMSDGRIIVIDVGRSSSAAGLVSMLEQGYSHYDRIVITHVHSDHAGGLITAGQYAKQKGSALSTDMLVSNHGEHDIDVVIRESKLNSLLTSLRSKPVVGITDPALAKLAFSDGNIAIEGIMLNDSRRARSENVSSLVLKVTEIRDGQRRATLFLGDIEKAQQSRLFSHPNAREIFRDVHAVTLPHHGRPTTIHKNFFQKLRKIAAPDVILLHSDRTPLDHKIAGKADRAGFIVRSTANEKSDLLINLFKEKTYHVVESDMKNLTEIVTKEKATLIAERAYAAEEIVDAVSRYCNRPASERFSKGTIINWPSDTMLRKEIDSRRAEFSRETERLITQLQSPDLKKSTAAEEALRERRPKLDKEQIARIERLTQEVKARRQAEFNRETERLIKLFQSPNAKESEQAERALAERRPKLSDEQIANIDKIAQEVETRRRAEFNRETERLIKQYQSPNEQESKKAERALVARQAELSEEQSTRISRIALEISENKKIGDLIRQLTASDEAVRKDATLKLSKLGDKINQNRINHLIDIMRNGKQEWRRKLYRQSHCTWYEYKSVKYYAADALSRMKSQYVSPEIVREAKEAKVANVKKRRVNDPGWI